MYWTLELAYRLEDAPWPATKDELIDKYGNVDSGMAIQLSDLNLFEYPFILHNYNENNEFSYLENIDSLKLLLNF